MTGSELLEFGIKKNSLSKMGNAFIKKSLDFVAAEIKSDEKLLWCFKGLHNFEDSFKNDDEFIYALTQKRLIAGKKDSFDQVLEIYYLDEIYDIKKNKVGFDEIISIATKDGNFNIGGFRFKECDQAFNGLSSAFKEYKHENKKNTESNRINITTEDSFDQLLKLKKLLDAGIISENEYESKKRELLNKL